LHYDAVFIDDIFLENAASSEGLELGEEDMEPIGASQGQPKKITKRGRPKGTFTTPPMFWNDVWLWVEAYRWLKWTRTGNRLSVSNACRLVAKQGGLSWAIGGNINAIASAMQSSKRPFSKWRRFAREPKSGRYVTDKNGRLVVSYRSQNGGTLRNRYMQAEMTVRNNPAVRAAWTNMVRDMLGLPRDSAAPPWVTS
jgi:hypothetical protein